LMRSFLQWFSFANILGSLKLMICCGLVGLDKACLWISWARQGMWSEGID